MTLAPLKYGTFTSEWIIHSLMFILDCLLEEISQSNTCFLIASLNTSESTISIDNQSIKESPLL